MGSFFRFFFAAPVAFITTALIFLGLYNQLSSNPFLYKSEDDPDVVYFGIADLVEPIILCVDCGHWVTLPEIPEPSNSWTESEKAVTHPPEQTSQRPDIRIIIDSVFGEDIQPCSGQSPLVDHTAPSYPKTCVDKGAQGQVIFQFDITLEGNVANLVILESPDDCFNEEVISSVINRVYPPLCRSDGTPTGKTGITEVITFEIAD